jgi:PAS domain S-box-containing protein
MKSTILVVDDSNQVFGQIKNLNEDNPSSHKIIQIDKQEIYQKAKENPTPYAIVIDESVFQDNGQKGLKSLKQDPETINIPVILTTDKLEMEQVKFFFDLGISDFVLKPLRYEELLIRIKSLSKRNQYLNKLYRENEHLNNLSLVARNVGNAVIIFFPDGNIEWVNKGFEDMYGYKIDAYLEKHEHEILSPNSKKLEKALKQFQNGSASISFEHEIKTMNDSNKWIQTTLNPIYNEQNILVKIIAVESDITDLREEKKKSDELLLNILPFEVAEQLKKKGEARSRKYKTVTVLFADFENFTGLAREYSTKDLIHELNLYVQRFDEIIDKHFIEKIKTIGDAYMCAGGLPLKNKSNPIDVTLAGLEIQKVINDMAVEKEQRGEIPWELRLGIHTGEVMAGVIGSKKFAYDIWGNTVNTASRMEETGEIGKVNVSGITYSYIADYFDCTYRGKIKVKNMAEEIDMYFVNRLKPEFSEDPEGIYPNAEFRKILAKY